MYAKSVRTDTFDAGHKLGLMAVFEDGGRYAFSMSIETAEGLIESLRIDLEQAKIKRQKYRRDTEAGVFCR